MIDYFVGWTEAELAVELRRLQQQLLDGAAVTYTMAGDVQVGQKIEVSIEKRIEMVLAKLHTLNPDDYPLAKRVSRTRIVVYSPENTFVEG